MKHLIAFVVPIIGLYAAVAISDKARHLVAVFVSHYAIPLYIMMSLAAGAAVFAFYTHPFKLL